MILEYFPNTLGEVIIGGKDVPLDLTEDLRLWFSIINPVNLNLPWRGNDIYFYAVKEMEDAQLLYKISGHWDYLWFVIGEIGGDPIIVKLSNGNPVFLAYHGEGNWSLRQIARNFKEFLEFLCIWIRDFASKPRNLLTDENGEFSVQAKKALILNLHTFMQGENIENIINFLE